MGQKSRTDLTSVIGSNIYNNNNKEITSSMVRTVLEDFRDSKFNLIDDELKSVTYQTIGTTKQTLEQYLSSLIGAIPLWGSTNYFDVGSATGDFEPYTENGIITSVTYERATTHDCELTLKLSKDVSNRKLSISIHHPEIGDYNANNDLCAPIIRRINSKTVKVALREVSGDHQKVRLELLAFKVEV